LITHYAFYFHSHIPTLRLLETIEAFTIEVFTRGLG